jgi:hypothetical protein
MTIVESIVSGKISEAKKLIEDRLEQIVFDKLTSLKGKLSEEYLKEYVPNVQRVGRANIVRVRIRGGKVQRRKKIAAVKGFTFKNGRLSRMSPVERRRRRMSARRAKYKRRAKMSLILRKRKMSLRKRKSLGL